MGRSGGDYELPALANDKVLLPHVPIHTLLVASDSQSLLCWACFFQRPTRLSLRPRSRYLGDAQTAFSDQTHRFALELTAVLPALGYFVLNCHCRS
jgi:hypothetical protein